jgi:hypothetical protein
LVNPIPCVPFALGICLKGRGELEKEALPLLDTRGVGKQKEGRLMMKKRVILLGLLTLLLALAVVALTACGGPSLVGKWQYIGDEAAYIEFSSDGLMEMGDGYSTITGTYEETGDKEITLTLPTISGEAGDEYEKIVLEYSFSGDMLTLDDGETPITFTRKK